MKVYLVVVALRSAENKDSYIHNSLKPHSHKDKALEASIAGAKESSPLPGVHTVIGQPFIREVPKSELQDLLNQSD